MKQVIGSQLLDRKFSKGTTYLKFVSGHTLSVPTLDEKFSTFEIGCYYWVAFGSASRVISEVIPISIDDKNRLQVEIKNITNSIDALESSMAQLSRAERTEFLSLVGFAVSGTWATISTIQTINALFAWEPVNAVIGAAMAGGAAVVAAAQYENLTDAQRTSAELLKKFNSDFLVYQATMTRYMPAEFKDLTLSDPRFTAIVSRLKRALPDINLSKFVHTECAFA